MALGMIRAAVRGFAQRLGGTRVGVLAIGRVVSPLRRWLYRRTGGRVSLTGRAPVLLLTTTGRRAGKARTVPLLYLRDGDRVVICNVNPGFERPNPWVLNLRAQPHAQVQIGRDTIPVRARSVSESELDRYWPRLVKLWPAYQTFYDRGASDRFSCSSRIASHDTPPGADRLHGDRKLLMPRSCPGDACAFLPPASSFPAMSTTPATAGPR
jgi:deazaflavin-dependent oxidoreductase (nitroreductase family)